MGAALLACVALPGPVAAQLRRVAGQPAPQPITRNDPVTFTADRLEYDRDKQIVTATGNVEAWQRDNVLKADRITFDRTTNVAAATGNVVMVQPDGQVVFSDYAELTEGLRDGVLKGMRALLAENPPGHGFTRRRAERAERCGLYNMQPVQDGSDTGAALADPRPQRRAGQGK